MVVIDVDSHFLEPIDWLDATDPELAAELPPPHRFMDFMRAGASLAVPLLPEQERPEDPAETFPPAFGRLMRRLDALQPELPAHRGAPSRAQDARVPPARGRGASPQVLWRHGGRGPRHRLTPSSVRATVKECAHV